MGTARAGGGGIRSTISFPEPWPVGGIILWPYAFDQVTYPQLANWAKCDGTNGTPDMRYRFARGTPNDAGVGIPGGCMTHQHGVGTYEMPSHRHSLTRYCFCKILGTDRYVCNTMTGFAGPTAITGASANAEPTPPRVDLWFIMRL